jgi:hypothetical protein
MRQAPVIGHYSPYYGQQCLKLHAVGKASRIIFDRTNIRPEAIHLNFLACQLQPCMTFVQETDRYYETTSSNDNQLIG